MLLVVELVRVEPAADETALGDDLLHELAEHIAHDGQEDDGDEDGLRLEVVDGGEHGSKEGETETCRGQSALVQTGTGSRPRHDALTKEPHAERPRVQSWVIVHGQDAGDELLSILHPQLAGMIPFLLVVGGDGAGDVVAALLVYLLVGRFTAGGVLRDARGVSKARFSLLLGRFSRMRVVGDGGSALLDAIAKAGSVCRHGCCTLDIGNL